MEKTVFQREDGTMSFLRIPLCTAVGTRFRLETGKTERQVPCSFDWKDTCLFCILLMQLHGMKANGMGASERCMMPDVAGDASIQIKALQCSHGFVCHFAASSIIVCFAQLFPFGLTQTMEFQQVNFKEIIFLHKGNELFCVFFAVIVAADGRLTQHRRPFQPLCFRARMLSRISSLPTLVPALCASLSMFFTSIKAKSMYCMTSRNFSLGKCALVSMAVWIPSFWQPFRTSMRKSYWVMGSPPLNVTPPLLPQLLKSLRRICRSSSLVYSRTHCFSARLGQMDVQGKSWQSLHLFQST